ncbi:HNH endonuclease [Apilactobacillus kunkeei]|uniref:HNH endonuclease n=1 Tax=Apilactobacillus kunkeei TaxID=148814 RepID=UPI00200A73C1|nr:HNH endonuclease [Apilactobacillus kunkeei]MCK8619663.1 HNH endonuclease [Apilactobacillus kunkeei]
MKEVLIMRKAIKGFEGLYEIDEQGYVYSLPRIDHQGRHIPAYKLKLMTRDSSRPFYGLCIRENDKSTVKTKYRHILVADTFDRKREFLSLNDENWAVNKKYPELEVSTLGRIRTKGHFYLPKSMEWTDYKLLSDQDNGHGYRKINFHHKTIYVHRMVAEAFIPNPKHFEEVNHKNEIRDDNRVQNLEWCTQEYNKSYGNRLKRSVLAKGNTVVGFGKQQSFILPSAASANEIFGKTGAGSSIKNNINGRSKSALRMHWYRVTLPNFQEIKKINMKR